MSDERVPNGFRLYYRYTKKRVYEPQLDEDGNQLMVTESRRDPWSGNTTTRTYPAPNLLVGHEPIEDPKWVWHRRKTYALHGHAKSAQSYHYQVRPGSYHEESGLETKIVPCYITEEELV